MVNTGTGEGGTATKTAHFIRLCINSHICSPTSCYLKWCKWVWGDALSGHFLTLLQWSSKFLNGWKEEVPGHPTRSHQVRGPQNPPRLPDLIECLGPDFLYIYCAIFLQVQFQKNCCLINCLATTRHIPLDKAGNIEHFIQYASGKPDPTLCSFHP